MAEKVTKMVIKVDLGCEKCRKKIKKVLCKIPEIRSQIYDEKANTVTITVVCCRPEMVKDKIRCKAGAIIQDIQIAVPPSPQPEKPKPKDKPKGEEPKEKPPPVPCCRECCEGYGWGPCNRHPCMPPPCYGTPVYDGWGGGCRRIYVSGCSDYVCEENPTAACTIM